MPARGVAHDVPSSPASRPQLGAKPPVFATRVEAIQRCCEVVDGAAAAAAAEAVPAARRDVVDVQARGAVGVKRAAHLAMARDLDAERPGDVDLGGIVRSGSSAPSGCALACWTSGPAAAEAGWSSPTTSTAANLTTHRRAVLGSADRTDHHPRPHGRGPAAERARPAGHTDPTSGWRNPTYPLMRVIQRDTLTDQPLPVVDEQPQIELRAAGRASRPSRSAARATAIASMLSDFPRPRGGGGGAAARRRESASLKESQFAVGRRAFTSGRTSPTTQTETASLDSIVRSKRCSVTRGERRTNTPTSGADVPTAGSADERLSAASR